MIAINIIYSVNVAKKEGAGVKKNVGQALRQRQRGKSVPVVFPQPSLQTAWDEIKAYKKHLQALRCLWSCPAQGILSGRRLLNLQRQHASGVCPQVGFLLHWLSPCCLAPVRL